MSFEYKVFQQSHVISSTDEALITNGVSAEKLFIRLIRLTNVGAAVGETKIYIVPNVAGALGTLNADDMILLESLAVGASTMVEFPAPGLVLDYNDVIYGVCDVAATINLVITGGREY